MRELRSKTLLFSQVVPRLKYYNKVFTIHNQIVTTFRSIRIFLILTSEKNFLCVSLPPVFTLPVTCKFLNCKSKILKIVILKEPIVNKCARRDKQWAVWRLITFLSSTLGCFKFEKSSDFISIFVCKFELFSIGKYNEASPSILMIYVVKVKLRYRIFVDATSGLPLTWELSKSSSRITWFHFLLQTPHIWHGKGLKCNQWNFFDLFCLKLAHSRYLWHWPHYWLFHVQHLAFDELPDKGSYKKNITSSTINKLHSIQHSTILRNLNSWPRAPPPRGPFQTFRWRANDLRLLLGARPSRLCDFYLDGVDVHYLIFWSFCPSLHFPSTVGTQWSVGRTDAWGKLPLQLPCC